MKKRGKKRIVKKRKSKINKNIKKKPAEETLKEDKSKQIIFKGEKKLSNKPAKIILISILIVALLVCFAFYYLSMQSKASISPTKETPEKETSEEQKKIQQPEEKGLEPNITISPQPEEKQVEKPKENLGIEVKITKKGFEPKEINVTKGSPITWGVEDGWAHVLKFERKEKSENPILISPLIGKNSTYTYTFNETSTWSYTDISFGFKGKISIG